MYPAIPRFDIKLQAADGLQEAHVCYGGVLCIQQYRDLTSNFRQLMDCRKHTCVMGVYYVSSNTVN